MKELIEHVLIGGILLLCFYWLIEPFIKTNKCGCSKCNCKGI